MNLKEIFEKLLHHQHLSYEEMVGLMHAIVKGELSSTQIGGIIMGLRCKGETITEITAAANVLRDLAQPFPLHENNLVDMVGTGGDYRNTFNITTACAFVVAAAGAKVAKHGNRSVSSRCGSADVLEAAGANLTLSAAEIAWCIKTLNVGFIFAPQHHPTLHYVQTPRRELGIASLFNLLGPLINPTKPTHQMIGVFEKRWLNPMAQALANLGSQHALVLYAEGCLDEISLEGITHVAELRNHHIHEYTLAPEQFNFNRQSIDSLIVSGPQESLDLINQVFANQPGPARDIVTLNAGAAIYVADLSNSLASGIQKAEEVIASGAAQQKFSQFIQLTQSFKS